MVAMVRAKWIMTMVDFSFFHTVIVSEWKEVCGPPFLYVVF